VTVAAHALEYINRGWPVVVIRPRSKRPKYDDWPRLKYSAEHVAGSFTADANVGVLLGDDAGGLVDVDLDCAEAIALAPELLPKTLEFGRASSRRSHRLYIALHARTEKFVQPLGAGKTKMLVELRANKTDGDGEGLQTVFPGSVHETGERVEWEDADVEIARVAPEQLRTAIARLAAAALLMRGGWTLERAIAFARTPAAGAIAAEPAVTYDRVARWLGFPARAQPMPAPRAPVDNRLKRASAYLARVPGAVSGNGGHQQTWTAALAVVRGFDLNEADAFDLFAREFNPRCDPPWSERELRHKITDAANNARLDRGYLLRVERSPAPTNGSNGYHQGGGGPHEETAGVNTASLTPALEWEPPVEFDAFDLPPFPVDALPPQLADFVKACAEATQTPLDLTGMLALAACAASVAKRCVVEVKPGYREPLNLFVATILPPGERKSAVIKEVQKPLVDWEASAAEDKAPEITRAAQKWAMSKKRLDSVTDRAAKAKAKMEREQLELEAEELAEQHAKLKTPHEPRVLADDATPEALASLLAVHGGRIAVFSAEGGIFTMMAGKYSDSPSLDVYLKAHAGDEIRVDRKGRPSERVTDPALTLGLAVQPAVLEALAEKPMLRGTGLLARFLYALPTSMLGARKSDATPIPDSIRAGYASALRSLLVLQESPKPIVLKFSPEAYTEWCAFTSWIEPKLGEFGEFDSIRDWAGKLAGATARIAGILSILSILSLKSRFEDQSISIYVERAAMVHAIELGKYLVPHAQAAISSMGADERVQAAKHILKCLRRQAWTSFSRRELHRHLHGSERFREADSLESPLRLLTQRNFIREAPQPANGRGRPPSPTFEVNPLWIQRSLKTIDTIDNIHAQPIREREPGEDDE
jgi:replicative DNA helicase